MSADVGLAASKVHELELINISSRHYSFDLHHSLTNYEKYQFVGLVVSQVWCELATSIHLLQFKLQIQQNAKTRSLNAGIRTHFEEKMPHKICKIRP